MRFLLDTNVCVRYLNGKSQTVFHQLEAKNPALIHVCTIVRFELTFGTWKSSSIVQNLKAQEIFCNRFKLMPFDDLCAQRAGKLRTELEKKGMIIRSYDLMIAAIALANDLIFRYPQHSRVFAHYRPALSGLGNVGIN